jgi:hypothetical protein
LIIMIPAELDASIHAYCLMHAGPETAVGYGRYFNAGYQAGPMKERAPRLLFQYACEKMAPEDKLRFRRSKPA